VDPTGVENVGHEILTRSLEFHDRASEHCLNQPPHHQSPALQAATAIKEKLSALKKQNKSETITIEMSLFIYPSNGTKAKKSEFVYRYLKSIAMLNIFRI
jgi:hypothetical protein